ncbi:MAG: hypothetical protein ABH816_00460 [Candidatus Levyibacteriota bacterium]
MSAESRRPQIIFDSKSGQPYVPFNDRELGVPVLIQQGPFDCVHTCLEMLGYPSASLPKRDKGLTPEDIDFLIKKDPQADGGCNGYLKLLLVKIGNRRHCVLNVEGKIVDPEAGVVEEEEYLNNASIWEILDIPVRTCHRLR